MRLVDARRRPPTLAMIPRVTQLEGNDVMVLQQTLERTIKEGQFFGESLPKVGEEKKEERLPAVSQLVVVGNLTGVSRPRLRE
uniref:Uncharacterized protein n=1 Tax=Vespula pensylvanica TaxID=30213 RepID=A0A834NWU0_VESPE|nr:hypothetical protein H0235_010313 [Vespula pensylvanica]